MPRWTRPAHAAITTALALGSALAAAQFNPARTVIEPPAVAARFPDPAVRYASPGLRDGRTDFPSHAEVLAYLDSLAGPDVRIETIGRSQDGRPIPMAVLSHAGRVDPRRPTVLVLGQQHGDEPAGGESALALIAELAGPKRALLRRVNVLVVPRANPDGAERFIRTTSSGIDVNRDHLLLRTPEARAVAAAMLKYPPHAMVDLHEFTVAGRWVEKFGVMQKYDALLQSATVGNLDPGLARLARDGYEARLHQALTQRGLNTFAYHTTSPDAADQVVSMGSVQPDNARNIGGLRPAVSLLVEVRGVGLGRAHLLRRVHTHVAAALEVIQTATSQAPALRAAVRQARARAAAQACRGELVVEARHRRTRQTMVFMDALTGADRAIDVAWRAAEPLEVQRTRARPCGYVIAADQTDAIERLRLLGARVQPVARAARWQVERYQIVAEGAGQRQDARGAIDDGADAVTRVLMVQPQPLNYVVPPGSVYVGLNQPLGALIAAALEPDSQNSLTANRVMTIENEGLLRVMARPRRDWIAHR